MTPNNSEVDRLDNVTIAQRSHHAVLLPGSTESLSPGLTTVKRPHHGLGRTPARVRTARSRVDAQGHLSSWMHWHSCVDLPPRLEGRGLETRLRAAGDTSCPIVRRELLLPGEERPQRLTERSFDVLRRIAEGELRAGGGLRGQEPVASRDRARCEVLVRVVFQQPLASSTSAPVMRGSAIRNVRATSVSFRARSNRMS